MFGLKRKKPVQYVPYNETVGGDRVWDRRYTVGLRAVGSDDGYPLIYAVTQHDISRIWKGAEQYADATEAVIAAQSHIQDAFTQILSATPEKRLAFSWKNQDKDADED